MCLGLVESGERSSGDEVLPLEGAKSASGVWKYFGFPARDGQFIEPDKKKRKQLVCKLCRQHLKYSGNTTIDLLDP